MKVKASTLLEALIALTLLSIAYYVALLTYLSIFKAHSQKDSLAIHQRIQKMAVDTKTRVAFFDEEFDEGNIQVKKTLSRVNDQGLIKVTIVATNNYQTVLESYNEFLLND